MKEDGTEDMQIERNILIPNSVSDPLATATTWTAISQAMEDNIRPMTKNMKELQEKNYQLEQENA